MMVHHMNKLLCIAALLILCVSTCNAIDMNYKISGKKFMKKEGNDWIDFGKFVSVNLGVTIPGYQPGQVIFGKEEYERAFKHMQNLGIHVVRVS